MKSYYAEKLAAQRLMRCYELAPPAVRRYLSAEIEHVRTRITPGSRVLELGCGYGRILKELASDTSQLVGIDISFPSLAMARRYLVGLTNVFVAQMDAIDMGFRPGRFDLVYCVQNGISAFHVDPHRLIASALAVTASGGRVLFSSYADAFWEDRLEWFRIQASHGLLGEIDEAATGNGVIVCKDGFRATTVSPEGFAQLVQSLGRTPSVQTVAESSLFCEIVV